MEKEKKKSPPVNPVKNMEITVNIPRGFMEIAGCRHITCMEFEKWAKQYCSNYVFQLEDSGFDGESYHNPHIQASVRLRVKRRPVELVKLLYDRFKPLFNDEWFKLPRIECSATSRFIGEELNYKYCSKEDTRLMGPFADHTVVLKSDLPVMDRTWQRLLKIYLRDEADTREIVNIYDPQGGCGKTMFQKHFFITQKDISVGLIDFSGSVGQILAATVNAGPKQVYFINMPWKLNVGTKRERLDELGQAIESIKDGFLTTSYYGQGKTMCFKPPHVVIFSNTKVYDLDMFADDRLFTFEICAETKDISPKQKYPHKKHRYLQWCHGSMDGDIEIGYGAWRDQQTTNTIVPVVPIEE